MVDRTAADVIRGFYSQVALCTFRWVTAGPDATVVTEGNEDIDVEVLSGVAVDRREESVKDLATRVSARSEAVHEAIAHFAASFLDRRATGMRTTFVFTTTAGLAKQHLKSRTQDLKLDILDTWRTVQTGRKELAEPLGAEISALLVAYIVKNKSRSIQFRRATMTAVKDIRKHGLWHEFLCSVEWNFDSPPVDDIMSEVVRSLRRHPCEATPWGIVGSTLAPFVGNALFLFVLRCSTRARLEERTLTRGLLESRVRDLATEFMALGAGLRGIRLITWVNWQRQVMYSAPSHSGRAVVAMFVSESDPIREDLARAVAKLKDSSFVSSTAKRLLEAGELFEAACESGPVGSELCKVLLSSSADFFIGLVPDSSTSQRTLRDVARARVKSSKLEVVVAAALDPDWLRETEVPVTLAAKSESVSLLAQFLADVFEHALSGAQPTPMAHELYARVRLVIDKQGDAHRQGSKLLVRIFEEH